MTPAVKTNTGIDLRRYLKPEGRRFVEDYAADMGMEATSAEAQYEGLCHQRRMSFEAAVEREQALPTLHLPDQALAAGEVNTTHLEGQSELMLWDGSALHPRVVQTLVDDHWTRRAKTPQVVVVGDPLALGKQAYLQSQAATSRSDISCADGVRCVATLPLWGSLPLTFVQGSYDIAVVNIPVLGEDDPLAYYGVGCELCDQNEPHPACRVKTTEHQLQHLAWTLKFAAINPGGRLAVHYGVDRNKPSFWPQASRLLQSCGFTHVEDYVLHEPWRRDLIAARGRDWTVVRHLSVWRPNAVQA